MLVFFFSKNNVYKFQQWKMMFIDHELFTLQFQNSHQGHPKWVATCPFIQKVFFFSFMLLGSFITYSLEDKLSITSILFDLAIAIDGKKMHK